ncbi:MAG TPA: nicotinate-nucleotide adenylyltransferase [Chthoniobacterales bacterium]
MRKIGIYGGTFDPIHHGHLILAREARERLDLETIIFVPAIVSPFKDAPVTGVTDRLEMLEAAIKGEPGFIIDPMELNRPPPSYTIDTVESIRGRERDAELFYLLGQDNVSGLSRWHRFEDLQKLVRFIVLDRTGEQASHPHFVVQRKIDISATEIRKRVASNRSIHYLVPTAVEEIIHRRGLYQEN